MESTALWLHISRVARAVIFSSTSLFLPMNLETTNLLNLFQPKNKKNLLFYSLVNVFCVTVYHFIQLSFYFIILLNRTIILFFFLPIHAQVYN